jgi:hypothetical protein
MIDGGEEGGEAGVGSEDGSDPSRASEGGFNAGDKDSVRKREQAFARERQQRDRDLRHLCSLQQFQRFFVRLLEDSKAFERSYDVSKRRLIEEGEKMAIMKIWHEIDQTQPDVLIRIMNVRAQKNQEKL